jgi:hypothetical protein
MGSTKIAVLLAAGVFLIACEPRISATDPATATAQGDPSTKDVTCPSQEFPVFLDAFVGNAEVQKAFTATPLRIDSLDSNAEPEPEPVSTMTSDFTFPVIPGEKEQSAAGLSLSIERAGSDSVVTLEKADTDYQVLYYFRKDACWTLYRKEDKSI